MKEKCAGRTANCSLPGKRQTDRSTGRSAARRSSLCPGPVRLSSRPDRHSTASWRLWSSAGNTACCASGKTVPSGSSADTPTTCPLKPFQLLLQALCGPAEPRPLPHNPAFSASPSHQEVDGKQQQLIWTMTSTQRQESAHRDDSALNPSTTP